MAPSAKLVLPAAVKAPAATGQLGPKKNGSKIDHIAYLIFKKYIQYSKINEVSHKEVFINHTKSRRQC